MRMTVDRRTTVAAGRFVMSLWRVRADRRMRGRPRDSRGASESCGRRQVSGRLSTGLDIGWPDIVERIALRVSRWASRRITVKLLTVRERSRPPSAMSLARDCGPTLE
jgi:hypothetical protein